MQGWHSLIFDALVRCGASTPPVSDVFLFSKMSQCLYTCLYLKVQGSRSVDLGSKRNSATNLLCQFLRIHVLWFEKTPLILERLFRETTSSAISTTHDESTFHLQSSDENVNLLQVWSLSLRGFPTIPGLHELTVDFCSIMPGSSSLLYL